MSNRNPKNSEKYNSDSKKITTSEPDNHNFDVNQSKTTILSAAERDCLLGILEPGIEDNENICEISRYNFMLKSLFMSQLLANDEMRALNAVVKTCEKT